MTITLIDKKTGQTEGIDVSMQLLPNIYPTIDFDRYFVFIGSHELKETAELYNFIEVDGKVVNVSERNADTVYCVNGIEYCKLTGITPLTLIEVLEGEIDMLGHSRLKYGAILRSLGTLDPRFTPISELISSIFKKEQAKIDKLKRYKKEFRIG